jgi:sRNA-binding protein
MEMNKPGQEVPKAKARRRSAKKPTTVEAPRTEEVQKNTMSKMASMEAPTLKVETPEPNKYAPKPKVGTPRLGRSPNYVESVGLGKLKVITVNGTTDV